MKRISVLSCVVLIGSVGSAQAAIDFSVAGLAGTGVTADVSFSYSAINATTGTISVTIENTAFSGRISGFAFNTPQVGGATVSTIAGSAVGVDNDVAAIAAASVTPEIGGTEAGWYALFDPNDIKTPNAAGDFDFGVMNAGNNGDNFITDGVGSGPRILNNSDANDSTTYTFTVTGTGLNLVNEGDWLASLSTGVVPGYNFGVRFQGIGLDGDSDLATTTMVPVPPAVLLGLIGLGGVGLVRRRR